VKKFNIFTELINLRFKSIQSNIIAAFLYLIVLTILVLAILSYNMAADSVENNSQEYVSLLIDQVNGNIDSYVKHMENISHVVLYNSELREYLTNDGTVDESKKRSLSVKITELLSSILSSRNDINSIVIFSNDNKVISNRNEFKLNKNTAIKAQSWYQNAVKAGGNAVVSSSHVQNIFEDEYRWVVSLSRSIRGYENGHNLGVLLVDLNFNVINSMCNKIKLGKRGYVFIVDTKGNIVYHPRQQLVYSNIKNEMIDKVLETGDGSFTTGEQSEKRIYTVKTSAYTGWSIVGVTYVNELVGNKDRMQVYYVIVGVACLFATIILAVLLSRRISKPVKVLEASMKEAEKGNFDIKVDIDSSNEIGELSRAFNIMISKIKELMTQNVKEQELKRKSELKALQAQINPHFLYNTLDSIIWMAEGKKSEDVVIMTSALAKLFRLSISKGEEIISIRSEIEHIKSYLTIQKIRYKDKLDFEIDVDPEILDNKTLKIILQPLVENAIYHGIKNKIGVGVIQIKGKNTGDRILMQVIDNGIGMNMESISDILEKHISQNGNGVGVKNVNERIKLYFGDQYGLEFISEPDVGTTANIWIPVLE
jgi:two-component system, sensor histidine kinase YesM